MSEKDSSRPDYPTTLDVVRHKWQEVQVVGSVQTGNPKKDIFLVKNTQSGETYRIKGSRFVRSENQDPSPGLVHRAEEGVKITGSLLGGIRQELK